MCSKKSTDKSTKFCLGDCEWNDAMQKCQVKKLTTAEGKLLFIPIDIGGGLYLITINYNAIFVV